VLPQRALVTVPVPPGVPPGWLRAHWSWLLLALPLLSAAGWFGPALLLGPHAVGIPVLRGTLLRSVVATGQVLTPYRINIGAQVTGTVAALPVEAGQTVVAGEVLIRLEDSEARAGLDQATAAATQAEAQLTHLAEVALPIARQTLRQAEATLLNAQRQFARAESLAAGGFGTRVTLDEARATRDVAISQVAAARVQVRSDEAGGTDEKLAVAALTQARASLRAAQSRLAYTSIAAPVDGILITRNVERGDVVQPLATLLVLSPAGPPQLELQIDERSFGLVALGQPAVVVADAYPLERFAARVSYINPAVDAQRASVEVKLDVPLPPAWLRQDMTVSVDITVARRPDALMLPLTALHEASGPAPWVLRADAGRARRLPVRLGLVGTREAEVLEGLAEHDLVLPVASSIQPDGRVRAAAP
jgi:HlyD family secretion protein